MFTLILFITTLARIDFTKVPAVDFAAIFITIALVELTITIQLKKFTNDD